ncbi:MAG: hypothetical protein A2X82_17610 [Geobacteraceae bacterium GWC2_55_20]|nr:MAG: hypothetical protein A2X82_17610 [Geobacteraceae bacterium GWC2_55_20]OGU19449.1 MAG: hypothetical protein A2X85_00290 [Geobacteraceae bacterium GWF2_54_21]HCE68260.1 hypothetical protein [Geobacter sp.]
MALRFLHYVFYKAAPASISTALTCCLVLSLPFLSPVNSRADNLQKFDLDINELKQRSISKPAGAPPQALSKKIVLPAKGVQKQGIGLSTKKTRKNINIHHPNQDSSNPEDHVVETQSREKLLSLKTLPSPGFIPTPSPAKTVKLRVSAPPCELIPQILVDFLSPVPTAEALHGVRMEALYAVRGNMITAAIACGLTETEEADFTRQLAAHGTRLINITGGDSPEKVVNKIAGTLGFSTQTIRATLDNVRLVYIYPADGKKENGIFISIANKTATMENLDSGPAAK